MPARRLVDERKSAPVDRIERPGSDRGPSIQRRHPPVPVRIGVRLPHIDALEKNVISIGCPDRKLGLSKGRLQLGRSSSRGRNNVDTPRRRRIHRLAHPVDDPFAVGRETRAVSSRGDETFLTAEAWHHVDATTAALRMECDHAAIGRKIGIRIVGRIAGQPNWRASVQKTNVDIQVIAVGVIGGESNETSIAGERGPFGKPVVPGDAP